MPPPPSIQEYYWEEDRIEGDTANDTDDAGVSSVEPSDGGGEGIQELLSRGGWSPSDVIVSIYYVGVDFEYRRKVLSLS